VYHFERNRENREDTQEANPEPKRGKTVYDPAQSIPRWLAMMAEVYGGGDDDLGA